MSTNAFPGHPNDDLPSGFQWAVVRREEQHHHWQRRDDELTRFDDPESSNITEFEYSPLNDMRRTIRLLKLAAQPSHASIEVECELHEVLVSNGAITEIDGQIKETTPKSYEALSWSWPTTNPEHQIVIREGPKLKKKRISQELVWALRYLRYKGKDRILWIDAICINQDSVEEKNHQVQMMSQIYTYAEKVCIWLGLDDKHSKMAINFISDEILHLEQFDALCSDPKNSDKWHSLLILMQRRWFFRRWVVQEIALARDATIYCGPDKIGWKDFSVAVELFVEVETATHRLSEVMKKDPQYYHVPGWFDHVSALGASLLVTATGMIYRYYKPESQIKAIEATTDDKNGTETGASDPPPATKPTKQSDSHGGNEDKVQPDGPNQRDANGHTHVNAGGSNIDNGSFYDDDDETETPATSSSGRDPAASVQDLAKRDPISERRELLSLEYLVSTLSIFEATQPRDAIYSLLAIALDCYPSAPKTADRISQILRGIGAHANQQPFPVDYGRAYGDVCQDFIEFCIARSDQTRALDIICRPWAPDPKPGTPEKPKVRTKKSWSDKLESLDLLHNIKRNPQAIPHHADWEITRRLFPPRKEEDQDGQLPSWIPRLDGAPFAMFSQAGIHIMKMGRKNADPLVGLPQNSPTSRNYNAAQSAKVRESLRFQKRRWQNTHSMFVEGFVLDTVEFVAHFSQSGNIPTSWLELGGWNFRNPPRDSDPPEEFWRTIVADRGKDGLNPPYYYSRACRESVYKGGFASGAVDTTNLINNERNSIVAQFCRRVQAVIWNRSLIRTRKGHLGIASKDVKKGDKVCILYGCSVPVILRRKQKSDEAFELEKEEDRRNLDELSKVYQHAMQRYIAKKRRKETWENRSEKDKASIREFMKEKSGKDSMKAASEEAAQGGKLDGKTSTSSAQAATSSSSNPTTPLNPAGPPTADQKANTETSTVETKSKATRSKVTKDYYEFLGECFIHGMMDGEAINRKADYEERRKEHLRKKKQSPRGEGKDQTTTSREAAGTTNTNPSSSRSPSGGSENGPTSNREVDAESSGTRSSDAARDDDKVVDGEDEKDKGPAELPDDNGKGKGRQADTPPTEDDGPAEQKGGHATGAAPQVAQETTDDQPPNDDEDLTGLQGDLLPDIVFELR